MVLSPLPLPHSLAYLLSSLAAQGPLEGASHKYPQNPGGKEGSKDPWEDTEQEAEVLSVEGRAGRPGHTRPRKPVRGVMTGAADRPAIFPLHRPGFQLRERPYRFPSLGAMRRQCWPPLLPPLSLNQMGSRGQHAHPDQILSSALPTHLLTSPSHATLKNVNGDESCSPLYPEGPDCRRRVEGNGDSPAWLTRDLPRGHLKISGSGRQGI